MRGAAIAAAVVAAAHAGCYWPIPSCDEGQVKKVEHLPSTLTPLADGAFQVSGRTYASCAAFCAELGGVKSVVSCEAPKPVSYGDAGTSSWSVACEVEAVDCYQPTIIDFGSGRRPEGFTASGCAPASVAAWLVEIARLEAASVPAFDRLARELAAHGAPTELVRRARRAMRDEVRHARVVEELARAHGASVPPIEVAALEVRELTEVARENAVEGCVGETLGAIVATRQALVARDPVVRAAFARIARDETMHAALSWDILAWSLTQPGVDRESVLGALATAARKVDARAIAVSDVTMREVLGLPDESAASRIIASAHGRIWARAA